MPEGIPPALGYRRLAKAANKAPPPPLFALQPPAGCLRSLGSVGPVHIRSPFPVYVLTLCPVLASIRTGPISLGK